MSHFGYFGAFLLDFWPFFRFFDPLFPKNPVKGAARELKPGSDRKLSLMRQFRDNLVQVFDEPRENDFYQASWDRNHENSPKTAKTGPNQPNTAIFEGVLSHFGHFGAFLLDICQFLRFLTHFSPKMPRKVSARDGPHVDAISPPQSGQDGACPSGNLRAVFRAFGAFRSFSPPAFPHPLRIRAVRETTPARVAGP